PARAMTLPALPVIYDAVKNASAQDPQRRITAWVLVLSFAAITLLDCMFFFIIPIVLSAAITLCLIMATLFASSAPWTARTHNV
ncbi:MAG TPA: hypothetical protein VGJ88_09830, partial [Thermoanaerobaculia bacterium]